MFNFKLRSGVTILLNVVLICAMAIVFVVYMSMQSKTTMTINTNTIQRTVIGKADFLSSYFQSQKSTVENFTTFIKTQYTHIDEVKYFLSEFAFNDHLSIQLIDTQTFKALDFSSTEIEELDYTNSSYSKIHRLLNPEICVVDIQNTSEGGISGLSPEFTNPKDGQRSVAFYSIISAINENNIPTTYAFFQIVKLSQLIKTVLNVPSYADSSAVLINANGDYILKQGEFRSDNIYSYFDFYNNPDIKEKEVYRNFILGSDYNSIILHNSSGILCLYAYALVPDMDDLFYVVCVPISSFNSLFTSIVLAIILAAFMIALIFINMMHLKSINRKLQVSLKQAEIANSAKTDFLSRMSHDMRTPMNGIIGMTTLTLAQKNLPKEVRDNILTIKDSSAFLLSLINDTLDMSKIESNKMHLNPRPFLLQELLNTILASNKITAQANGISFQVDYGTINVSASVFADPVRIAQIYMNIISNAIKFTPVGGSISITLEELERKDNMVKVRTSIVDTGIGIDKDFLNKIFDPFVQEYNEISASVSGTGLGLTIVKHLIEMMNGTISIESEKGKGTSVFVEMTYKTIEGIPNNGLKSLHEEDGVFVGKHILLVEDNMLNMKIAKKILETKGIIVRSAANGLQAVQIFSSEPQNLFDCILMDIRMPIMDGLAATRAIRQINRDDAKTIPIIAMTANAFEDDAKAVFEAGMSEHLAKPVDPEYMFETLRKYLHENAVTSELH